MQKQLTLQYSSNVPDVFPAGQVWLDALNGEEHLILILL